MKSIIEVRNLTKKFQDVLVLNNVNLTVKENEFLVIMGRSGSGKSTLLYSISGMDSPSSGDVIFNDKEISKLNDNQLSKIRLEEMGFVFQNSHLLKKLSVYDNIALPAYKANKKSNDKIKDDVLNLLKKTDIESIANSDIMKVSGGQLQRAAICRALINEPKIIFGDEPTGALNSSTTKEVLDLLNQINNDNTTLVIVTHDTKVALRADRVIFLTDGKVTSELILGKYNIKDDHIKRETTLNNWLEKMNF